jgi:hypothetical protein
MRVSSSSFNHAVVLLFGVSNTVMVHSFAPVVPTVLALPASLVSSSAGIAHNTKRSTVRFVASPAPDENGINNVMIDGIEYLDDINLDAMTKESTSSSSSTSTSSSTSSATSFNNILLANLVPIAAVVLTLCFGLSMASTLMEFLANETVREAGIVFANIGSFFMAMLGIVLEALKVLVPVVGKGVYAGVQAAAPAVGKAAQEFGTAAQPYVQDASETLSKTAAPVLDSAKTSLDFNVMAPVKGLVEGMEQSVNAAVDTNVRMPVKELGDSFHQAVDTTFVAPVKGLGDSFNQAVDATFVAPVKGLGDSLNAVLDTTFAAPVRDLVDGVNAVLDTTFLAPVRDLVDGVNGVLDTTFLAPMIKEGATAIVTTTSATATADEGVGSSAVQNLIIETMVDGGN